MTIQYFLAIFMSGQMQIAGPFHGLIACEAAANQVRAVSAESNSGIRMRGVSPASAHTACLSQKARDFKYKEPKK